MVQGHHHHVAAPAQVHPVVERRRARAGRIGPAMDVDHHRPPPSVERRGPHVQEQAVLAGGPFLRALWRGRAIGRGVLRLGPGARGQGRQEAAAGGVLAVAQALEHPDPLVEETAHRTAARAGDRRRALGAPARGREQQAGASGRRAGQQPAAGRGKSRADHGILPGCLTPVANSAVRPPLAYCQKSDT